jgi:rod shape determining protein RodA
MIRWDDLDRPFVVALVLLLLTGLIVVYSACQGEEADLHLDYWQKQIVFAFIGIVVAGLVSAVPPSVWERMAPVLYVTALAALTLVLVAGESAGGARRWISIGGLRFQPSELSKVATVLFLARLLANRKRAPASLRALLAPVALVLVPAGLTLKEPDLGTALVFLAALPPMLYWSGVSLPYLLLAASPVLSVVCASSLPSWIAFTIFLLALAYFVRALMLEKIVYVTLAIVAGVVTPILWGSMELYQQQRIVAFLDPAR